MLITRLSLVATPSLRSEFEQQLCVQLLSLSEVVEVLVDRVLDLEERFADGIDAERTVNAYRQKLTSSRQIVSELQRRLQRFCIT